MQHAVIILEYCIVLTTFLRAKFVWFFLNKFIMSYELEALDVRLLVVLKQFIGLACFGLSEN